MRGLDQAFLGVWLGCSPVLVDQSAEDWGASDRCVERDDGGGIVGWWVLVQALVRAVVIEVAHVLVKNSAGVLLVVDQHAVGAFGADAADEPFRIAVRLWHLRRDLDDGDGFRAEDGIEGLGEFRVPVADQEAESADLITEVPQEVPGGLGGPGCGRVRGHPEEMDPSGADFHDEQDVEAAQPDGLQGEEVGGQQAGGLSAQEGKPPGVATLWRWPESSGGQNPADCARA